MHNIFRIAKGDLKSLFTNTMSVIIAIGLVVLPSIFVCYNVLACWDVFENTGNLKVAVANTDEGYESDLVPLRINVGDRVVSALRENDQLDWTFVDKEDAIDGVKSGRYYAAVVIPVSFSKDMLTFYSSDVQHAEIEYYINEKKNAISPKIIGQGADTISYQINKNFAETLSEVSLGLAESLSHFAEDINAVECIADVSSHVRSVSEDVVQVASVLEQYSSLVNSSQKLINSSVQLVDNAQGQFSSMRKTASEGASAVSSAADALKKSSNGLSSALSVASESLDGVAESANQLFVAAFSGSTEVVSQMREQAIALDTQIGSYCNVVEKLEALRDQAPGEFKEAFDAAIVRMNAVISQLEQVRDNLRSGADKLEAGDKNLQEEHQAVKQAIAQAKKETSKLKKEFNEALKPTMEQLAGEVATLVNSVGKGLDKVTAAGKGLSSSAESASSLLGEVGTTLSQTAQGLRDAADELKTLADDIDKALATGNSDTLRKLLGSNVESLSKAIAAPIGIERIAVFPVENFGSAMAPLYTTIALFVGALLILVAVNSKVSDHIKKTLDSPKPRELFLGHFGVMAVLSLAQTTFMSLASIVFLQVQVAHPLLLMLCFWFAGLVFTFLVYSLVAAFANLGKAVAVLLLVVQVTGCGGSFPLQRLPSFVQILSPWLPATHVVNAMRAAMFGVYHNDFWIEMGKIALFIIPAVLIGLVLCRASECFMRWYVGKVESSKLMN